MDEILRHYNTDNAGVRGHLKQLLSHGALKNTGKLLIYPPDQGFEHGPGRSFSMNPDAYDPFFHFQFALDAGFSAIAAPLGLLEAGAHEFAGTIPFILKVNHSHSLYKNYNQVQIAHIDDALRLGCIGVGYTIYPGSSHDTQMFEKLSLLIDEAKKAGLFVIVWSYPRGEHMTSDHQTALDVVAYGAHMACLMGAHIVKTKIPSKILYSKEAQDIYPQHVPMNTLTERIQHVVSACFASRRLVIFSGGEQQNLSQIYEEAAAIVHGGGHGSIIARNCFKRPRHEAMDMIQNLIRIYQGH
jgi:class I fructose-bisphosphate aldolase